MIRIRVRLALAFFLFCLTFIVWALPEDRLQFMHVEADSADLNQASQQGIYRGHVEFDQGSTHIRAAEAITTGNNRHQLTKAIIKGDATVQAHFWTLTDQEKPELHAYADTIYYLPVEHLVKLVGHSRIEQGNNSFSAPTITYNTETKQVKTEKSEDMRTTIIFHPEKQMHE